MKISEILRVLRELSPERLAETWDHVGLAVGDPDWPVRTPARALLCIDLTEPVLAEALRLKAAIIVAYHPPIFEPMHSVTAGDRRGRIVLALATHRVAVYSPHTALDAAAGGVNDWLAHGLGRGEIRPIRLAPAEVEAGCKVVAFVPFNAADAVRGAMSSAGAGVIGRYTECSFNTPGQGTFRGGAGANPVVGRRGVFERVPELRMEMVVPRARVAEVVAALRASHPYEEPAFDVYPLYTPPNTGDALEGQGRVLTLDKPTTLGALAQRLKRHLNVTRLDVAQPARGRPIRRVGLCAGAGGSLLAEAGDIDAFITGEMRHHDVLAAVSRGLAVLLAGHTQTERPYLREYRRRLTRATGRSVAWTVSRTDAAPLRPL